MPSRPRSRRLARALLVALVTAAVAGPVSAAARPAAVPAPTPAALPFVSAATPVALDARYAVNRSGIIAAERTAANHGDQVRAGELRAMAAPGRHFLSFDGRDGGRTTEVFGDLSHATRIAVLVPGADTDLDTYERFRAGAVALQRTLGARAVVVAWLGYATPSTLSPDQLTLGRADQVAPELRTFVHELSALKPAARVSLLCHSYGSVVCARAAAGQDGLDVADIVLYGSPGTGAAVVSALHTRAAVWAGRGTGDWIGGVPHIPLHLPFATVGFGTDPVSPEFGAHVFAAGDGGHSDYLKPGSVSLDNIARIVSGQTPLGPRAPLARPAPSPHTALAPQRPLATPVLVQEDLHA
jgi:hypothetical protein